MRVFQYDIFAYSQHYRHKVGTHLLRPTLYLNESSTADGGRVCADWSWTCDSLLPMEVVPSDTGICTVATSTDAAMHGAARADTVVGLHIIFYLFEKPSLPEEAGRPQHHELAGSHRHPLCRVSTLFTFTSPPRHSRRQSSERNNRDAGGPHQIDAS